MTMNDPSLLLTWNELLDSLVIELNPKNDNVPMSNVVAESRHVTVIPTGPASAIFRCPGPTSPSPPDSHHWLLSRAVQYAKSQSTKADVQRKLSLSLSIGRSFARALK
jgi:hypothetical protein